MKSLSIKVIITTLTIAILFFACSEDNPIDEDCTIGAVCNDDNANTENDVFNVNCICEGTLTCIVGATCDDGNANTSNDQFDANCNCVGELICSVGQSCDDGICSTNNDQYNNQCECEGVLACVVGQSCDDGNPDSYNDVINECCVCEGIDNIFAGEYVVTYSDYWRLDRQSTNPGEPIDLPIDWVGQTRTILAYNDTTLSKPKFWGPYEFQWDGEIIFYVGINDVVHPTDSSFRVTIPTEIDGIPVPVFFGGDSILTCESDPAVFNHHRIPGQCDVMVVPDAGGPGIHRIYLTFGYMSYGVHPGEREYYEILQKLP